ncbi:U11/U12 small nuclear ribonucleoprotein 25 kDa protein-like [Aricia agestis]|uniref:U11/U12 small nuclear ribonucleoprotein 25 kDa protein-like n=1 Tax=Aricia agestis TaxID=91739 RepID=UPI001C2099F7|nr:U11/U12 small nuclear ribonucleoprotein 25 kDa protein-like [Aricia agestis]
MTINLDHLGELVKTLSHEELNEVTKSSLSSLFKCDAVLSDLPSDITYEEITNLTAVEHGQSITIIVAREDEVPLKVIVPQKATVKDLKKAVARSFENYQNRTGSKVKISWKYLWKTYNLCYDSLLLDNDNSSIDDYGVGNKVTLTFKKKRNMRKAM